jgi:alanine racemase
LQEKLITNLIFSFCFSDFSEGIEPKEIGEATLPQKFTIKVVMSHFMTQNNKITLYSIKKFKKKKKKRLSFKKKNKNLMDGIFYYFTL